MPEYRVLRIEEQMYGCTLPCPDKELTRLGIDEGSRVHLLPDGTLQKISEELL